MNKPLILVVEDDAPIRNLITTTLKTQDYKYIAAATASEALQQATIHAPDVMLLDLGLPDLDGIEVIRRIRSWSAMPIIVISARSEDSDKIEALDSGADDYLTKPFSVEELLARIGTILKRSGRGRKEDGPLTFLDLELDDETREVFRDGNAIELTDTEFRLLRYLMNNPRRVLTRGQILDHVWEYDFAGDARVLETYISYLRRKLDLYGPGLIITVRGVGYALREPKA